MSAKIKDHKVNAIKIGGILLVSKSSVEKFAAERKASGLDVERKSKIGKLMAVLSNEEIDRLLAQVENNNR